MAITDKKKGVWGLDQTFNKINQGSIWTYSGENQLKAAGSNAYGQLGQNNTTQYSSPVQVPGTWDGVISGNWYGSGATKSDGTLWVWGRNIDGSLGVNSNIKYSSPVQVPGTTWPTETGKLIFADDVSAAIKTDGTLWMWGNNGAYNEGKLGQNNTTDYSSPVQIPGTTWSAVNAGNRSSAAIKTDGTLWTWGSNAYGMLGLNQSAAPIGADGSTTKYSSPVQVPGTTWSKMPERVYITRHAIKTDGTLWAWGTGGWGTLGQNDLTQRSSPVQIPGTTWSKFHVGDARSRVAVIKTDNTLWMWGTNADGALGLNQAPAQLGGTSSPIQIPGSWDVISMSYKASYGIKTDGTLWTWGRSTYGALGHNDTTQRSSPTQIPGDWTNAVSGLQHAFFAENA